MVKNVINIVFNKVTYPTLSMLTAVWGRTRHVNTRLEAVRKVMSTVVGLERMAGEATSTYLAVAVA